MRIDVPDDRPDYGEKRIRTIGFYGRRMVMMVWTPRGNARRVISMRYCHERERERFRAPLEAESE